MSKKKTDEELFEGRYPPPYMTSGVIRALTKELEVEVRVLEDGREAERAKHPFKTHRAEYMRYANRLKAKRTQLRYWRFWLPRRTREEQGRGLNDGTKRGTTQQRGHSSQDGLQG